MGKVENIEVLELPESEKGGQPYPKNLSPSAYKELLSFAEALFPAGKNFPEPDYEALLLKLFEVFEASPVVKHLIWIIRVLNVRSVLATGYRFSLLSLRRRRRLIDRWSERLISGALLRVISAPLKIAYLELESTKNAAGIRQSFANSGQPRNESWQQKILSAQDLDSGEELEVDAIVVGSGAGGAVAAYELASKGLAVLIVEEGEYFTSQALNGDLLSLLPKLYRASGATASIGNCVIPIPLGCNVGGTTTINSGTAMRALPEVFQRWRSEGLWQMDEAALDGQYKNVESVLQVANAEEKFVGPTGKVTQQGAERLGFKESHCLPRCAPGCDGQSMCQFGCPTGAKQSTNFSYLPLALKAGAFLYTGFKVTRLIKQGENVLGVVGVNGSGKEVTIRGRSTVVAMGALNTPVFLKANGIMNPWLGKNLSIHPSGAVTAYFDQQNFNHTFTIPQGFGIKDWAAEGLMFEGGTPPFLAHGMLAPTTGAKFVEHIERFQQTAYFGAMVKDTSRGSVWSTPWSGYPFIHYHLNEQDFVRLKLGLRTLARLYLKAGADSVKIAGVQEFPALHTEWEIEKFFDRKLKPRDLLITAYHPLGTARIAATSKLGVCDFQHKVFGQEGLYVMDGGSVPGSLGANPQLTIMAMAARAGQQLAEHLSQDF